jgi:plastocyanin
VTAPASEAERLAALERQRRERQASRRDWWLATSVVLSALALAMVSAAAALGFGARGADEAHSVGAAPTAPAQPCKEAAGFPDSAEVTDEGTEPASGSEVSVEAGDSFFGPTCTGGVAGGTVTLTVQNTGHSLHNVTIADQGIDEDVAPGETITVQVTVGSLPVRFECKYHRTSGMVGALLPATS